MVKNNRLSLFFFSGLVAGLSVLLGVGCSRAQAAKTGAPGPVIDSAFWAHWGDGKAELSAYRTKVPRYGELRDGTAVAIFVTEDFSNEARVKADPGRHPKSDVFPVMKLNLVEDFQTGIYDYNLMTSVFVGLAPFGGLPAGFPAKISFSAQDWCGHGYGQWLFDPGRIRHSSHSYFDGEADQMRVREGKDDGLTGDTLWHWARGFAQPVLAPGQSITVPFLPSVRDERLTHQKVRWTQATLRHEATTSSVTVPAGTFTADVLRVKSPAGEHVFYVEHAGARRIVKWTGPDGAEAVMLGEKRLPYWALHDNGHEKHLADIGLKTPPRATDGR